MENLLMRLQNLENLPEPTFPTDYLLRDASKEDVDALAALLAAAFPEFEWNSEKVAERLTGAADVFRVFVVEHNSRLVATASARYMPDEFPDEGYLHWVAVEPEFRGKGIGKAVSLAVLHEFAAKGYKSAVLETQDSRLPAIKIYQDLGFEAVHVHHTHALRWAMIANLLASAGL